MPRTRKPRSPSRAIRPTRNKKIRANKEPQDVQWLVRIGVRMSAARVLNDRGERHYWLSVPKDGPDPVSDFFPCTLRRTPGRLYYGFMFREHRDEQYRMWANSRKELTSHIPARS